MSREDIVAVASRLFAVYLLLIALRLVPAAVQLQGAGESGSTIWSLAAVFALVLAVSAMFWLFPLSVARKLLPAMKETPSGAVLDSTTTWNLAISILGLWLFAGSLSRVAYWTLLIVRTNQVGYEGFEFTPEQFASAASTLVELLVGLTMVLGSNGIRNTIQNLRGASVPRQPGI